MSEVPLKPFGKEDIRKLELALIIGSIFRKDVLQKALETIDKITWLDSLIVAAGALARERAGYTSTKIAEELGRTEATIRSHLQGKTEAGKIVKETYQNLVKNQGILQIEIPLIGDVSELKKKIEDLEKENKILKEKMEKTKKILEEAINVLS